MNMRKTAILALVGLAWGFSMAPASAQVTNIPQSALLPSAGYYTDTIGGGLGTALLMTGGGNAANEGYARNDDGFSGPITLNWTSSLSFFGGSYTQFWANNNGNISFGNGISAYTPTGPQGASQPIISPFFADVDTRDPASGLMYMRNDHNQLIMTWDHVGYYDTHADKFDSFQMVLRGSDYAVPVGEGRIGFFWNTMEWETGDASNGYSGFGGTPGAVGFGNGSTAGYVLEGSMQNGIAGVVAHHQLWFYLNTQGEPEVVGQVPEPETYAMMLAGLGLLGFMARRRKQKEAAA